MWPSLDLKTDMILEQKNFICQHFGICGGCSYLDVPYEKQLELKSQRVTEFFKKYDIKNANLLEILPSVEKYFYRNKMEFVFSQENTRPIVGLRQKNKFYRAIDIKECYLFSLNTGILLDIARNWADENKIQIYDLKRHKGNLRYLVIRESKSNGQLMVNVIVSITPYSYEYEFSKVVEILKNKYLDKGLNIRCMTVGLSDSKADVALANKNFFVYGEEYIEEKIGKFTYRIFPYTFFQTNTFTCEKLYQTIKNFVCEEEGTTAIDLFCGSGGISIYVSEIFEKIIGIEQNEKSVQNAYLNAEINKVTNCEFVNSSSEDFLKKIDLSKFGVKLSTVIVDPPRPGLSKRTLQSIVETNPRIIIYVSCNLESLLNDLKFLVQFYKIDKVQPVDMFPHTPHLESVVRLVHR